MRRFFFYSVLTIGFVGLALMLLIGWSAYRATMVPESTVLHISLDGPLPETPHPNLASLIGGKSNLTLYELTDAIRRAATDKRIVGLVLDIGEPQLALAQIAEIADAMDVFNETDKPSISFLESAGESGHGDGAYALAVCAGEVVLAPPGDIGLSGLRAEVPFVKETLDRLHVQSFVGQRYEYKDFANTFTQQSFTPEHRESLKAVIDDLQANLLKHIAAQRNIATDQVRNWVAIAPFSAEEAVNGHLVDRLGYWDQVLDEARKLAGRDEPFVEVESYKNRVDVHPPGDIKVALITGAGEISRGEAGGTPFETHDGMGSITIAEAFREARKADMKAVLFRIDSPGGSYIASDVIRREVELTRKAGIPVVVSMGNVAASGGYFVAVDADYIVAQPSTITGSIGVVAVSFALRDALHQWFGVTFDTYDALPHSGALSWLDPPDAVSKARLDKSLDRIYKDFVGKVANGRHKTFDDIHKVAKGRIWSGNQAKARGLIDATGGMNVALDYIRDKLLLPKGTEIPLTVFPEPEGAIALLRGMMGGTQTRLPDMVKLWYRAVQEQSRSDHTLLSPWHQVNVLP